MLRKKQVAAIVSVVTLFLVGTMLNVNFMALSSDDDDDYGVPFRKIWFTINDLYLEFDNTHTALGNLWSALDTYMEKTDDAFVAIEAAIGTIEEITNHTKTMKFVRTGETAVEGWMEDWTDAALFMWTPTNSTNNAILNVYYYAEYKIIDIPTENYTGWVEPGWRIVVNGVSNWHHQEYYSAHSAHPYAWAPLYSWVYKGMNNPGGRLYGGIVPNQPTYTIKFQIRNTGGGLVVFRNFNIIIEVTDGL